MKYCLVEVVERDIKMPEFFDTFEEAHAKMEECYFKANGCNPANYDPVELDGELSTWTAYCSNVNDDHCDWEIFKIK